MGERGRVFSVGKCARAPARLPTPTLILFFSGNGAILKMIPLAKDSVPKPPTGEPPTAGFEVLVCAVQLLTLYPEF